MNSIAAPLTDQARHVLQLLEASRDDDLDGLCTSLEAAEQLVGQLKAKIRRLGRAAGSCGSRDDGRLPAAESGAHLLRVAPSRARASCIIIKDEDMDARTGRTLARPRELYPHLH
jgi:hypothetical protein